MTVLRLPRLARLALALRHIGIAVASLVIVNVGFMVFGAAFGRLFNAYLPYGDTSETIRLLVFSGVMGGSIYIILLLGLLRMPAAGLSHGLWRSPLGNGMLFVPGAIIVLAAQWGALAMLCADGGDTECLARATPILLGPAVFWTGVAGAVLAVSSLFVGFSLSGQVDRPHTAISAVRGNQARRPLAGARPRSIAIVISALFVTFLSLLALVPVLSWAGRWLDRLLPRPMIARYIDPEIAALVMGLGLWGLLILAGGALATWAIAFLLPDARVALAAGGPPHVLFLRPFGDRSARRFERWAQTALEHRGPFVAIGEPGDAVPRIGALRTYTSDADWRQVVSSLIAEAETIVVVAGTTPGVVWELREIRRLGRQNQTLILVPAAEATTLPEIKRTLEAEIGLAPLPSGTDDDRLVLSTMGADGHTFHVVSGSRRRSDIELAIYVALHRLGRTA